MSEIVTDTASGKTEFLYSCPWHLLEQRAVIETSIAWTWWDKSQLQMLYPGDGKIPVALINAITAFNTGLNRGQRERIERDRKDAERKRNG